MNKGRKKTPKRKPLTIPLATALTAILSLLIGGSGWIVQAVEARADTNRIAVAQQLRQHENELAVTHDIDVAQTAAISDMKSDISAIKEQTKQLGEIRSLLMSVLQGRK